MNQANTAAAHQSWFPVHMSGGAYRLLGLLLLGMMLSFSNDAFLTVSNLLNVLRQASLVFLIASGLTLVIISAGLDLSVGANVGLSAVSGCGCDSGDRNDSSWGSEPAWHAA